MEYDIKSEGLLFGDQDIKAMTAIRDAVLLHGSFSSYIDTNRNMLKDFFYKVKIKEKTGDQKTYALWMKIERMPMSEAKKMFNEVYKIRSAEYLAMFDEKEIKASADDMSALLELKMRLIKDYGDKLAGMDIVNAMTPQEAVETLTALNHLSDKDEKRREEARNTIKPKK